MKKTFKVLVKALKYTVLLILLFLLFRLFCPTWTPKIKGESSINELRKVEINNASLTVMIRGCDRENPVVIFVHGGPCCSEIPYVRKYQEEWEKSFTIVHYDQRGSGKSYKFGEDYSGVTVETHVEDLISLTEYIKEYLETEQIILAGHSFGTYIGTIAVARRPDLYQAYVGIGQMGDTTKGELYSLKRCIAEAEMAGNQKDVEYLEQLEDAVANGECITPRNYVRNYGFAARKIDDNADYLKAFLFGTEYNLLDMIRFYTASIKYQDTLVMEGVEKPLTEIVTEINVPVYFVMGKYDGMTPPEMAREYLQSLTGEGVKEFVLFEESAHYPQFEEKEAFAEWMGEMFVKSSIDSNVSN